MEVTVQESASTIDMQSLLKPIPGESRAGIWLRYSGDGIYDAIEEAGRSDEIIHLKNKELAEQEASVSSSKVADWPLVASLATEVLRTRSKDLQVAVWLLKALVEQFRFAGLRDGLYLIKGLQEQYWDVYFPQIEDGNFESRCAPLKWLNLKVPMSLKEVQKQIIENAGTETSQDFYEQMWADVKAAQEAATALGLVVNDRFGRQTVSLNELKDAIADCVSCIEELLKIKRSQEQNSASAGQGVVNMDQDNGVRGGLRAPSFQGMPTTRAEALNRLASVAAYFRLAEPHSPVSYLVQRAVQWGKMSLEDWLKDVINNEGELMRVKETLGLKEKKE